MAPRNEQQPRGERQAYIARAAHVKHTAHTPRVACGATRHGARVQRHTPIYNNKYYHNNSGSNSSIRNMKMHSKNRILFIVTGVILLICLADSEANVIEGTAPGCEIGVGPFCFNSQYHTPDQWPTVASCQLNNPSCLPVPQSIYEDLFGSSCGGFCKKSAYRANMCQETSAASVSLGDANACCPDAERPVSKKCIKKSAAEITAETKRVGCASMYGTPYYEMNTQCKADNLYAASHPFTHGNYVGVPKFGRFLMRIAVNSLTPEWKPAPSSFKVKLNHMQPDFLQCCCNVTPCKSSI